MNNYQALRRVLSILDDVAYGLEDGSEQASYDDIEAIQYARGLIEAMADDWERGSDEEPDPAFDKYGRRK